VYCGRPVQEKAICPVKPPLGVRVSVDVPVFQRWIVRAAGFAATAYGGEGDAGIGLPAGARSRGGKAGAPRPTGF
jgi:hypothetical protein